MRSTRIIPLLFFLALLCAGSASHAIRPPPSKIVDGNTAPACLVLQPAWLGRQSPGFGADRKGAAISLTNKCDRDITLTSVAEAFGTEAPLTPVASASAVLQANAKGYTQYIDILLDQTGADCSYAFWTRGEKKDSCKNLLLAQGDTLVLPVTWGKRFLVTGDYPPDIFAFWSGPQGAVASGKMINPEDPGQAIDSFMPEAEKGDATAQLAVGKLYQKRGAGEDMVQAAIWLRKASDQGVTEAQFLLGLLYKDGKGVPQDDAEEYFWMALAANAVITDDTVTPESPAHRLARLTHAAATGFLVDIAQRLKPEQLAALQKRAADWKPQR